LLIDKSIHQNDDCPNAEPIEPGDIISGTTIEAAFDSVGFCGTSNTAPGVWYKIVGNGDLFIASTCNDADYDTKISVFEGSCGTLACVTGNDDTSGCSGFTTEVRFVAALGMEYLILVHGFTGFVGATGNFNLALTSIPVVRSMTCQRPAAQE
jgi:hypothetical protein